MPNPSLQEPCKLGENDQIPKLARSDLMGKTFFLDGFSRQGDLPGCMNELRNGWIWLVGSVIDDISAK